jgi:hypothetical protein
MRDGIYKSLNLGRGWRSLLKSCERAKERGETAENKAHTAVARDFNLEVSGMFVQQMLARVRQDNLLPGFRALDSDLTCRDLGGNNSPLENDVLATAKRLDASGVRGRSILDRALGESLERHKRSRMLQIQQHCLSEIGLAAKPIIEAVRHALSRADTASLIDARLQGKTPKLSRGAHPINLDESLESVQ